MKAIGGNHDDMFLCWLDDNDYRLMPDTASRNSGQQTIRSFYSSYRDERDDETARAYIKENCQQEVEFLRQLPDYAEDSSHIVK